MNFKSLYLSMYILFSFIILLITNNYFNFEQSLIFGAMDGYDYYTIANQLGNITDETLSYHKAWRFILPSLIGIIADFFDINT